MSLWAWTRVHLRDTSPLSTQDRTQHTCTAFRAPRLAAARRQPRPSASTSPRQLSVALCSAEGEPHCKAWTGRGSDPGVALIHHRYGNYHSVLSEPSPDPVLSETGPPGDTDYKTLQLRVSLLQSPAQLLSSSEPRRRRMGNI